MSTPSLHGSFSASDGTPLFARRWPVPAGVPRAGALLLLHGLGEHSGRYEHVAAVLAALGLEVRAYDQRGFGRSGGARATLPRKEALLDDLRVAFAALARDATDAGDVEAPFVLGHSMGGCVVARAVTGGWIAPRGMVLSSPALLARMSRLQGAAVAALAPLLPHLQVPHGLPLDRLSHDPEVVVAVRADPLAHDRLTPRLASFLVEAGAQAIADAPRCTVPTLLLVAGDDHLVQPEGAYAFHARLHAGIGTLHRYADLWHETFNERAPDRATVLGDLAAWLQARLAPRG